jgi:hypothetical protein
MEAQKSAHKSSSCLLHILRYIPSYIWHLLEFFFLYSYNKEYKCGGEEGAEGETENGAVNKRRDAFVYEEEHNDYTHVCK